MYRGRDRERECIKRQGKRVYECIKSVSRAIGKEQLTATRCNTLQYAATHCNTQAKGVHLEPLPGHVSTFVCVRICVCVRASFCGSCARALSFFDGYCSTVQGLLDWFEVDLGFTELSFIQIDFCVLCVFVLYSRVSLSSCPFWTFYTASPCFLLWLVRTRPLSLFLSLPLSLSVILSPSGSFSSPTLLLTHALLLTHRYYV